jgi:phosphopantetheinyl transferase
VLKEAYLKALGSGLAEVPLDSFWLEPRDDGSAALHHPAVGASEAARWRFALLRHGVHALAVAARAPRGLVIAMHAVSAGALLAPSGPAVATHPHPGGHTP